MKMHIFDRLCATFLIAALTVAIGPASSQSKDPVSADTVVIDWIVSVHTGTPKDATLYIAGSPAALGAWSLPGMALIRRSDGRYSGEATLARGSLVEYKVTRGMWETVEKGRKGEEISNRQFKAEKDAVVEIDVASWASSAGRTPTSQVTPASQRTGTIRTHEGFKSKVLANERTLWVWLPPDYENNPAERYPVLYMHDGQNLFDALTAFIGVEWAADETADRLIRAGRIRPNIIVAIDNTPDRMNEYTPWVDGVRRSGGKGEAYGRFLINEVKPFIDQTYRTKPDRENTGVAGSSLGGLISLHLAMTHAETFSKCAALSPALMWADGKMLKEVEAKADRLKGVRLWFDMGTGEGRQIETFQSAAMWTQRLAKSLEKAGFKPGVDYRYLEVSGGEHNEAAWSARFDQVLEYLFGMTDSIAR